ncbi:serine/threonine protein kinase [Actinomadura harenae]|uniref:non-specific serine/threonine protein kinase n=2 Tax=Actinomadura harenae TaxID=2483351 RepID=A0A3M2LYV2_9ACTN|nr:serine/threonine protein kinase [Actinomadura harenae]
MGEVWSAQDGELGRPVAIKILPADLFRDPEAAARLRQEARTAATLQHPGITVVHDFGDHGGRPYLVMELLNGRNLAVVMAEHQSGMPPGQAARLMIPVVEALGYAHRRGVVHRDIKPANLMLLDGGGVKICDFGIARHADAATSLTLPGAVLGSPPFMAPEQWRGEPADARTDLYALGATLHVLLTGQPPFPGPGLDDFRHQHLGEEPPRPTVRRPDHPGELEALVQGLLAKDPAGRPEAMRAATVLRGVIGVGARPMEPPAGTADPFVAPAPRSSPAPTKLGGGRVFGAVHGLWRGAVKGAATFGQGAVVGLGLGKVLGWAPAGVKGLAEAVLFFSVVGAVAGAVLGCFRGLTRPGGVLVLDADKLTVTRGAEPSLHQRGTATFSIPWHAVDRIAVHGSGARKGTALLVWFRDPHRLSELWLSDNRITPGPDGSHIVYGAGERDWTMVRPRRLREALPLYAGNAYDPTPGTSFQTYKASP